MAVDVVVGEGPANPPVDNHALKGFDAVANMRGREIRAQQIEGVAHVQLVAAGGISSDSFQRPRPVADLANRRSPFILIEQRPETLQEIEIFRLRLVVEMVLHAVGIGIGRIKAAVAHPPAHEADCHEAACRRSNS